jgi:hypothetical protein
MHNNRDFNRVGLRTIEPSGSIQGGGAKGNRTPDLFIANEALYQLSYSPKLRTAV